MVSAAGGKVNNALGCQGGIRDVHIGGSETEAANSQREMLLRKSQRWERFQITYNPVSFS